MITFKEFMNIKDTEILSEGLDPEKREVLLAIKDKYEKFTEFRKWLAKLHAGVMDDNTSIKRAWTVLRSLDNNGIPVTFADRKFDPTEVPNYQPDGRLTTIYKPYLLGKNPDLSQYSKSGNAWVKNKKAIS